MGNKSSTPTNKAAASTDGGSSSDTTTAPTTNRPIPKNLTLLTGCTTLEEHEGRIRHALDTANGLSGEEGLRALGFEFRFVPCCPAHAHDDDLANKQTRTRSPDTVTVSSNGDEDALTASTTPPQSPRPREDARPELSLATMAISSPSESSSRLTKSTSVVSMFSNNSSVNEQYANCCHSCATRLFFVGQQPSSLDDSQLVTSKSIPATECQSQSDTDCVENEKKGSESNDATEELKPIAPSCTKEAEEEAVMITTSNRQQMIADGIMYELVANLAQEAAQAKMCTSFDLEWTTICNDQTLGNHVRAMVDRDHRLLLEEGENRVALQELLMGNAASTDSSIEKEEKKEDDDDNENNDQEMQQSSSHPTQPQHPTSRNKTKSTLLIATGRGKVRAGIFSRHHLLTAGIEVGTSWHCIREARMRKWGVAIVDPNARGDVFGYESMRKSLSRLFLDGAVLANEAGNSAGVNEVATISMSATTESKQKMNLSRQSSCTSLSATSTASSSTSQQQSIYILAHSASGGQLVRHLREDPSLLPSIRSIAFTDSTHNVQWCKHDPSLQEFLQKKNCVYLRSNDVRSSQSCVKVSSRGKDIWCTCSTCASNKKFAGVEAETDHFWQHRFGSIKTVWAGTADHALSNWAGHESIWDHFDEHASSDEEDGRDGGSVNDADGGVDLASL